MPVPTLTLNDFSPSIGSSPGLAGATLNQMDFASFSEKFGTLTMRGGMGKSSMGMGSLSGLPSLGGGLGINGLGGRMLREESRFDLAGEAAGDDEMF